MMDRTDRHYRRFMREITRRTLLYTEMVTTDAVLRGKTDALLGFDPEEKPLALQLGGDDPGALAECARIAEDRGYDEVNLNVGCPSDRVRQGRFGASLMAEPDRVAAAVTAMRSATALPVTVKHRIGIDDLDRYEDMERFVAVVAGSGCDRFSVHARKAVLGGLTPKENRSVPPLRYEDVHRLKREHPELRIEINGGIRSLDEVREHLAFVDGVMIGRAAYDDPFFLSAADREFYGESDLPRTRRQVVEALVPYVEARLAEGVPLGRITRHMLGLFAGQAGARHWRRQLSENANRPGAGVRVLLESLP
jgi:tRNA-dihydrouridine synthase A